MTAGDVWRVLRANAWLITSAVVLGGLIGFFANMYLARNYSRFTATGWVQIAEKRFGGVNDPNGTIYALDTTTLGVEQRSQSQLLRTDTLINSVLSRPAVRDTSWFKQFVKIGPDGTERADIAAAKIDFADKLAIVPLMESKLIELQFSYSNPDDCATLLSELVEQHPHAGSEPHQEHVDLQEQPFKG
jgi:uncharacterized protein involved in exopolysaccharide biosynthesis